MVALTSCPIYALYQWNSFVIMGLQNGSLIVLDSLSYKEIHVIPSGSSPVFSLTANDQYLYAGAGDGTLHIFDSSFTPIHKRKTDKAAIRSLLSHKNEVLAGTSSNQLLVLDPQGLVKNSIATHTDSIFSVCLANQQLITVSKDARIHVFDWPDLKQKHSIEAHWYQVKYLDYNPRNQLLISTSMDKTIRLWDTKNWTLLKVIDLAKNQGHRSSVNCGLWLDKKTVISCSDDRSIMAFQIDIEHGDTI